MTLVERRTEADLAPAPDDLDGRAITTVRMLAADMVERAASGHPGLPLGAAPMAWVLWSRFLRHDPRDPTWADRDRFVLSAGHGSALLYALLHVFGYTLPLDELRRFRQWGSRTPGHPEAALTPGVETTTGPLGQGFANAVGMALAERMLAARYNRAGLAVVDHRTYVLASDGDLMEGVSHEAASLAGHLGLGRLVVLYDDNGVTIDGPTALTFSDDTCARFAAYGWHTQRVDDGNGIDSLTDAIAAAVAVADRPSLVAVRTTIGFGAPSVAGTAAAHGAPLGAEELAATRRRFGWPDRAFHVPPDVAARCRELARAGRTAHALWNDTVDAWEAAEPTLAAELARIRAGRLPALDDLEGAVASSREATRVASGRVLARLAECVPEVVGGSADLAGSTNADLPGAAVTAGDYGGRVIHFGVREHAMAAMLNGIALHGGLRPFGSTFLVFSDYLRPALRLSALSGLPVVYVFTHDSIGLGEDGPTHQPVEHLAGLRAIPNLAVLRPADGHETARAWEVALERRDGPTAIVLTRQAVPPLPPTPGAWFGQAGARLVSGVGTRDRPAVTLVATGSEVALAVEAADILRRDHDLAVRVVSMPWRERFLSLPSASRDDLVPAAVPTVVVEAGAPQGWEGVAGPEGAIVALDRFGASAPGATVLRELGFRPDVVVAAATAAVTRNREERADA
ncbi:MAG: transketolase [Acidimicrobiales bacterium]